MDFKKWLSLCKKSIQIRGEREKTLFKRMKYAMGRTKWDYEVTQLLSPQSSYYHVDEVMRSYFYEKQEHIIFLKGKSLLSLLLYQKLYIKD